MHRGSSLFPTGDCDAHAKNYAILYRGGRPELAPAYDLLSTMAYDTLVKRFAMRIGGESRMGMLKRKHFAGLAKNCGLNPKLIQTELRNMTLALPDRAQRLAGELNAIHPDAVYRRIVREINRLCRQATG